MSPEGQTPKSRDEIEQQAREIYRKLERNDIPAVFTRPEDFELNGSQRDLDVDPVKLLYRTSNSEYGSFAPSILEMPTQYRGKTENLLKQENYVNYRSTRMNCELDKHRYINPTATIRRK